MKGSFFKGLGIYFLLLLLIFLIYDYIMNGRVKEVTKYNDILLVKELKEGIIDVVSISQNEEVPTGYVYVKYNDDRDFKYYTSDVNKTQRAFNSVKDTKAELHVNDIKGESWFSILLPILASTLLIGLFMFLLLGRIGGGAAGGANKAIDFGKSRAKMSSESENKLRFKDVAGLEEEKEELEEIVDFLKNPKKYTKLGARIPKGILLVGPPGTGKTLMAKAISGEAGVPFFTISGSDFVEMFVGVGASRVRDLFADAKKNSPCIIFIDEIDAVARRRGSGLGGGHDEREQTLNQMLVEMDGFGPNEGIIVMAATNRVDILDPAILRPGRFDRKISVGKPDVKGREEILKVHVKEKPIGDDVDLHEVARTTAGFAGADLENLMNEAAIRAARDDRAYIIKEDIDKSFIKIGIGSEKKSRLIPEKEKKITAFHEAGHAILFHLLSEVGPVHLISIITNGNGAAGYTMPLPENDNVFMTKKKMLQDIMVSFGGRIAEEIEFEDVTTGAYQDIKQATQYARAMVTRFGMSSEVGYINYETDSEEVFLGRDLGHSREFGEEIASTIDKEVKRIIDECYKEARNIIEDNYEILKNCAKLLLEKERVARDEFEKLFVNKYGNGAENTLDSTIDIMDSK